MRGGSAGTHHGCSGPPLDWLERIPPAEWAALTVAQSPDAAVESQRRLGLPPNSPDAATVANRVSDACVSSSNDPSAAIATLGAVRLDGTRAPQLESTAAEPLGQFEVYDVRDLMKALNTAVQDNCPGASEVLNRQQGFENPDEFGVYGVDEDGTFLLAIVTFEAGTFPPGDGFGQAIAPPWTVASVECR